MPADVPRLPETHNGKRFIAIRPVFSTRLCKVDVEIKGLDRLQSFAILTSNPAAKQESRNIRLYVPTTLTPLADEAVNRRTMIILIAKPNLDFVSSVVKAYTTIRQTKNTITINISIGDFRKLHRELDTLAINPYAFMVW